MIEDKSFFQKKLLEQAQIMEENIIENILTLLKNIVGINELNLKVSFSKKKILN